MTAAGSVDVKGESQSTFLGTGGKLTLFCVPRGWDNQHRGPCASVLASMRALMSQYRVPASMGAAAGSAGRGEGQGSSRQELQGMRRRRTVALLKGRRGGGLGACPWLGVPLVNSSSPLAFSRWSSHTPSTGFSRLVSPTRGPLCPLLAVTLLFDPLCLPRASCKGRPPGLPGASRTVSVSCYK